eukprot:1977809-Rhodomonas_salina.1
MGGGGGLEHNGYNSGHTSGGVHAATPRDEGRNRPGSDLVPCRGLHEGSTNGSRIHGSPGDWQTGWKREPVWVLEPWSPPGTQRHPDGKRS